MKDQNDQEIKNKRREKMRRRDIYKKIFGLALTIFFCLSPQISSAIPLNDLFAGGTYQFDNLKLTDWQLVKNVNVDVNNIDIGAGYHENEFGVLTENHELLVSQGASYGNPNTKTLSFDFLVTGMGVDITHVKGALGYRRIRGYYWDSPWMTGSIAIGTSKGSNDLGLLTDVYSFNQNKNTAWINIPNGVNQIWMRTTITLNSSHDGYAEAGYIGTNKYKYGPAFRNEFITHSAAPVPEPSTILLLGIGLIGLAGTGIRRKKRWQSRGGAFCPSPDLVKGKQLLQRNAGSL
jgi:hypothetical protein